MDHVPNMPPVSEAEMEGMDRRSRQRSLAEGTAAAAGLGLGAVAGCGIAAVVVLGTIALAGASLSSCEFDAIGDPGDGKESLDLPIVASPAVGLRDGSEVLVTSDAFTAGGIAGVTVCLAEARDEALGIDGCDVEVGERFAVLDGGLQATYRVPQRIEVGGSSHDCGERPGRCLLVAASASDYDVSGGAELTFAEPNAGAERILRQHGGLPVEPSSVEPLAEPGPISVTASGFQPGEPLLLARCTAEFRDQGPDGTCWPLDADAAVSALAFRSVDIRGPRADADGRATVTIDATATIQPVSGLEVLAAAGTGEYRYTLPEVDCTTEGNRCVVVVAAAADPRRSAMVPYRVLPG